MATDSSLHGRAPGPHRRLPHGWSVQHGEYAGQIIAHTTGLARLGAPELVVAGVGQPLCDDVLAAVVDAHLSGAAQLRAGVTLHGIIVGGYTIELVEVIDTSVLTAAKVSAGSQVRALQLVLPDPQGRFPWDPHVRMDEQPLLGVPTADQEHRSFQPPHG